LHAVCTLIRPIADSADVCILLAHCPRCVLSSRIAGAAALSRALFFTAGCAL
jgi:hypothetical protein